MVYRLSLIATLVLGCGGNSAPAPHEATLGGSTTVTLDDPIWLDWNVTVDGVTTEARSSPVLLFTVAGAMCEESTWMSMLIQDVEVPSILVHVRAQEDLEPGNSWHAGSLGAEDALLLRSTEDIATWFLSVQLEIFAFGEDHIAMRLTDGVACPINDPADPACEPFSEVTLETNDPAPGSIVLEPWCTTETFALDDGTCGMRAGSLQWDYCPD